MRTLLHRAKAAIVLAAFACLALASCSAPGTSPSTSAASPGEQPVFSGPFAGEFAQTWQKNEDAFIRGIIADQKITDQEWAEVVARMKACFESEGMSVREYNADGSYSFDLRSHDAETGNRLASGCEESSGVAPVGRLRISMQANPDNRDMDELMHECLVRVGAVPRSYSLEDYRRDSATFSFPFVADGDKKYYDVCAASPLTAQRGD